MTQLRPFARQAARRLLTLATAASALATFCVAEQPQAPQFRRGGGEPGVYKARLEPHWFDDSEKFWYRNELAGDEREFILVDAAAGERRLAFDHERLAAALTAATGDEFDGAKLPFREIEFSGDDAVVQFRAADKTWACNLESYNCFEADGETATEADDQTDDDNSRRRGRRFGGRGRSRSPDGRWRADVRDDNIVLRPIGESDGDGDEIQLTTDGGEDHRYDMLQWSPDSKALVAFRVTPGDDKEVHLIESSPRHGGRAQLHSRPYALPGDKFATYELNVFDVAERKQTKPDVETLELEWERPLVHWCDGGASFAYTTVDRGHQRYRLIKVDVASGEAKNLIDDSSETFIWTAHTENVSMPIVSWLEHSDEAIYASERDGWRHLYLVGDDGIKQQITSGEFVVRGIDRIDEARRQIWFRASGKNADQDPYFMHAYRVDFDGSNLVALTEADGTHNVQYSPNWKHLVDTYSRVDLPPVHELRSAVDGRLICKLDEADASEARERGWIPPEVFVAKGRDDRTDIWGLIYRPKDFDPAKKYPIIEQIYAGPQGSFTPKAFSGSNRFQSLTDLGYIVVQMDGMGTANRSKAFHDVCWHNLKDGGFPDRIRWIKAAAEKYPSMDLDRIGIYGGSAGGQNACAAVLFHPDFYKVAVAGCGCHDNRMDKASWNEQWMGYPVGPQYAECSNIDNAHRLQGKLMLIVGEMDTNVPPESTLRLADALIKADKDFDLVLVPGAGHGMGGEYGNRRMHDFFVRHLLDEAPPDRNVPNNESTSAGGLAGSGGEESRSSN
jgi:dipeptidyl aminopeptidase/acylaminoacyl peptidase